MKKSTFILCLCIASAITTNAQTTIFLETFGTTKSTRDGCVSVTTPGTAESGKYDPSKNELYADHDWSAASHVWNSPISYAQTSDPTANAGACDDSGTTLNIRTNNPSDVSYYSNASASGNLYFNSNVDNSFIINGINTSDYNNVTLSFGVFGKNKADVNYLKVQYSTGGEFIDLATTEIAALATTKQIWQSVSSIALVSSANLALKFSTPNKNGTNPIEIRVDDIKITGTDNASGVGYLNNSDHSVAREGTTLKLAGFESGNVQIYSAAGRLVYSTELHPTIQLASLPKGFYVLKIGDYRQKFVW